LGSFNLSAVLRVSGSGQVVLGAFSTKSGVRFWEEVNFCDSPKWELGCEPPHEISGRLSDLAAFLMPQRGICADVQNPLANLRPVGGLQREKIVWVGNSFVSWCLWGVYIVPHVLSQFMGMLGGHANLGL
jgi:hypothetical protein